jgi:hypothetical protein
MRPGPRRQPIENQIASNQKFNRWFYKSLRTCLSRWNYQEVSVYFILTIGVLEAARWMVCAAKCLIGSLQGRLVFHAAGPQGTQSFR